ncbi:MAG: acetylxylan esterase [Demequinaceae bacterium]|nr:acetylxylan esterase [Demequinaceae bacterium]
MAHYDLPLEELRAYAPTVREPADFDSFWQATIAESRGCGGEPILQAVDLPLPQVEAYDLTFPGFGGHPIKAWYSRPSGRDESLPVVVQFQGYGGGRGLAIEHTFWASAGFAHVMMDTRGQGSSWGGGGETPDPGASSAAVPGFMTRGILDRDEYYFRRVFTDAVRAVDAARSLPGVDASRTLVTGGSQGGGIALAAAGLVSDLVGAMIDVPFLCHYERALAVTDTDPFGEIRRYLAVHRAKADEVFDTLSYFDGVNLAKRTDAPALFSVGLMDQTCPPSTVFAAFNAYAGRPKDIAVYPYNGHEGGGPHQTKRQFSFAQDLVG